MLINVRYFLLVVFTFYGLSNAAAATLDYEVYALQGEGKRELLGKGTKEYELADLVIVEKTKGGVTSWSKSVLIWEDFSVGASIYKEPSLTGFGLWIKRPGNGFSWDWFDIEDGAVFRKLQGGGKVRVETEKLEGSEELLAVEFLTDVTLRGSFSSWMFSTEDTHHLVIKKGSLLMLGN